MNKRFSTIIFLVLVAALLAAVACGSSSTASPPSQSLPTQSLPTVTPVKGNPPPEEPAPVEVPAPIEDAAVVFPAEPNGVYSLTVTSGLPSGCAEYNGFDVKRDGNRFTIEVNNLMPHPSLMVACTEIYGYQESTVVLGRGLVVGETYTVAINSDFTVAFTAQDEAGLDMVEKESPIEEIEVTEADGGYTLHVISRLPMGSSCSRSNGYELNTRFVEGIFVTVTHLDVGEAIVECTADLPVVVTDIPLGSDFEAGVTYNITVNGTETTFPKDELAMVEVAAPIEGATVVLPGSVDGDYALMVTSGLPSGCARFSGTEVERSGSGFVVDVTNLMPDPREPIACTAVYGYHQETMILGSGLVPGEAYTVTINGELTISFTAMDLDGLAMVEMESPIESAEVTEADGGYLLTVVSRLPKGSSCSRFNGYEINRRFAERIEVTVTHMEVAADDAPCTFDLPVVLTEIPLGKDFEAGRTYTVSVNGEESVFTAN